MLFPKHQPCRLMRAEAAQRRNRYSSPRHSIKLREDDALIDSAECFGDEERALNEEALCTEAEDFLVE